MNRDIAKALLEMRNLKVVTANNGQEAVDAFMESASGYYDCILMDIRMPIMDGLEATKRIRGLLREDVRTISIIAMSANAFSEDVHESKEAGMNAHISKPFDVNELYGYLANAVSHRK